jgi:hypothetical protein
MYHQFDVEDHTVSISHDDDKVYLAYSFAGPYGGHYTVKQKMSPKEARRMAKLIKRHAKAAK